MRLRPGNKVYFIGGVGAVVEDVLGPRAIVEIDEPNNEVMRKGERYEVAINTLVRNDPGRPSRKVVRRDAAGNTEDS